MAKQVRKNNHGYGIWKRGDSWVIEMTVKGTRYRETLGPVTRTFAREMAAKRRTELLEGRLRPKMQDPVFQRFLDRYLQEVSINKAEKSHARDKSSAEHLKRFFSGRRVLQISRMDIERYKRDRKAEIEAKGRTSLVSVNRELALLSHAFNVPKLSNPTRGVKRFEEFGRERFLDEEEEQRLFGAVDEIDPKLEPLFQVLINAGYRVGEVLALRNESEMINFEEGYIRIPRMMRKGKKKDVVTPLNNVLREALRKAIQISGAGKSERIFPYLIQTLHRKWKKIRKAAGLEDGVRIHDLRHTFGARAAKAAQDDPYAVQALMGHTDFKTTQKYIHVPEARKRSIMERLGSTPHKSTTSKKVDSRKSLRLFGSSK
jgi:integrase